MLGVRASGWQYFTLIVVFEEKNKTKILVDVLGRALLRLGSEPSLRSSGSTVIIVITDEIVLVCFRILYLCACLITISTEQYAHIVNWRDGWVRVSCKIAVLFWCNLKHVNCSQWQIHHCWMKRSASGYHLSVMLLCCQDLESAISVAHVCIGLRDLKNKNKPDNNSMLWWHLDFILRKEKNMMHLWR